MADPYTWHDALAGIPPEEVARHMESARFAGRQEGRREIVSASRIAAETRQTVHDEIVAYVASLHFTDTFEHQFLKIAMGSMKYVALNGYRAP